MSNKELLKFLIEIGADEAIADHPRNYFAEIKSEIKTDSKIDSKVDSNVENISSATEFTTKENKIPENKKEGITHSPALAAANALEIADNIVNIDDLEAAIRAFDGCMLKRTAAKTVFADGIKKAKIMIIGEAPGAQEDMQGIPFCGPSGALLDKILAAAGFSRKENVYISNSVFWRPPGNRQPSIEETTICLPFVEKHIALIKPEILLLAGGVATLALLKREESMSRLRGKTYQYQNKYLKNPIPTFVTYHPSYLLRQPSQKRLAWQDMLMIKEFLKNYETNTN